MKYRKNIGNFVKKLVKTNKKPIEEVVQQPKEHVKKLYDDIKTDQVQKAIDKVYEIFTGGDGRGGEYWPNGVMFHGVNCKGKEKAIEDLVAFLENRGWDIVRIPRFDASKAEPAIGQSGYCFEYLQTIVKSFAAGRKKYTETGRHTAFVLRDLDAFTGPCSGKYKAKEQYKKDFSDLLLAPIEYLQKEGCSLIAESSGGPIDKALKRFGRIDWKVPIRPLQEDGPKAWDLYLQGTYCQYKKIMIEQTKNQEVKYDGFFQWGLQNAIDLFPEQHRASSRLYQKLKDTRFYPFEF